MGIRARFIHMPPSVSLALTSIVGLAVRDIVLTRDEVDGLMAGLLTSKARQPARLDYWLNENAHNLGRHYESELQRNFRL